MNTYRVLFTDTRAFYVDVRASNAKSATRIGRAAVAADCGCLAEDENLMTGYIYADTIAIDDADNVIND
jgi:non-homologous end joining protein Ku